MTQRRASTVLLAGIMVPLLVQAGHVLAYGLHFGPAAVSIQSAGSHAYFPAIAEAAAAALGAVVVLVLLLAGLGRLLMSAAREEAAPAGGPVLPLFLGLLTAQVAVFAAQELLEARLAGMPAPDVTQVVLHALLGQAPVALAAAVGLRWTARRLPAVLGALPDLRLVVPFAAPAPKPQAGYPVPVRVEAWRRGPRRRGPPTHLD